MTLTCSICNGETCLETEGGRQGFIGILPICFCPSCLAGVMDFAEQELMHYDEDYVAELVEKLSGR